MMMSSSVQALKPWFTAARVLAALTVATVVLLFGTAGVLVQDGQAEDLHGVGALLLHTTSGLLTLTLAFLAYRGRLAWTGAAVSAVLFGLSFVQAAYGSSDSLNLHVPGAFLIGAGSVGLATWLFIRTD
ncbi:hypothetical protein SZN_28173 [Streptomyces zinciresistens K42]|uniref:Integral membrane protein n=1 Tax=Streptomyces zinciresistens K42 TaxID=700597 RepID=G2GJE2_9ACTN|nr:hypothetical protein [Streptomyces zinciresistens]EGX56381.1 hypothetical protein SZN_28173 [Streptomyces zinciresistens K42]